MQSDKPKRKYFLIIIILVLILSYIFFGFTPEVKAQSEELADLTSPVYGVYLFLPNRLIFKIRNFSNVDIADPFVIRFQWLRSSDSSPINTGYDYNFTNRIGKYAYYRFDTNNITNRALVNYILNKPEGAIILRIDLNSTRSIAERSYSNNTISVSKSNRDLDLVVETLNYDETQRQAAFSILNNHPNSLNNVEYKVAWISPDGKELQSDETKLYFAANELKEIDSSDESSNNITTAIRNMLKNGISGATKLRLIIDPYDDEVESNEDNNIKEVTVTPLRGDLEIVSPQYALLADNLKYRLTFQIRNKGNAHVIAPFPVKFTWFSRNRAEVYPQSYDVQDVMLDGVFAPGEVYDFDSELIQGQTYNYLRTPASSDYKLLIELDPDNVSNESDKNNSRYEIERPLPDFYFENINLDQNNRLIFTIKNNGLGSGYSPDTSLFVHLKWNTEDDEEFLRFSPFAPGAEADFDSTWPIYSQAKTYLVNIPIKPGHTPKLLVQIDKDNRFAEADENNNAEELVGSYYDLALLDPLLTPEKLTFRVKNIGTLNTTQARITITPLSGNSEATTNSDPISLNIDALNAGSDYRFDSIVSYNIQNLVNSVIASNGTLEIKITDVRGESNLQEIVASEPSYNNSRIISVTTNPEPQQTTVSGNTANILIKIKNSWESIWNKIFGNQKDYLKDEIKSRIDSLTPTPVIKNIPQIQPTLDSKIKVSPLNETSLENKIELDNEKIYTPQTALSPTKTPVQILNITTQPTIKIKYIPPTVLPSLTPTMTPTPTFQPIIPINTIAPTKYQIIIIKTPTPKPTKKFNLVFP